jgi:rod shape determining protein RodA
MSDYQKNRVHVFVHQGSRDPFLLQSLGHQLHRSKVVVGTGDAWGIGLGEATSEATKILPERHSDFVFPVLVTAFGTVGTGVFLLLFLVFVALLLRTAIRVREPSGRLLAVGAATLFLSQALINMAMTVGLLPIVGLTLPFVSYGGSSLVTSFVALGLALNAGADPPVEFGRGDFE